MLELDKSYTDYKKIFDETVPKTTAALSKLIKKWKATGVLDNLLKI